MPLMMMWERKGNGEKRRGRRREKEVRERGISGQEVGAKWRRGEGRVGRKEGEDGGKRSRKR